MKKTLIVLHVHTYLHKYICAQIYKKEEGCHDMMGGELSEQSGRGQVGLKALKTFEREIAHLERHLLVFQESRTKSNQHIVHGQGSPGGLLSQREEEDMRLAVSANVHKIAPEYLLDPGAAPGLQVQAEISG